MIAKIHVRNEVWATVRDIFPEHVDYLYEKYAPFVEGYRYMTPYVLGRWDGRIKFFEKNGVMTLISLTIDELMTTQSQ